MKVFEDSSKISRWIQHIPKDWKLSRLANVSDIRFSNVDKHTVEDEVPVYLCNYVDVYKKDRITGDIDFMEASADAREIERFQILKNDVLVTKDSETADDIAISALVVDDLPAVLCGYHLALIRPRTHLAHGPYLAWLHACKSFRAYYEAKAVGVTRFGLSQAAFKQAPVPLPPLPEQCRIAAYLDKTCYAIDTAIDKKQKQLETLDALRKSIIHKAVTRGLDDAVELKNSGAHYLGKLPSHWKVDRLKNIVNLRNSKIYVTSEEEDYLELEDIEQGTGKILSKRNTVEVESAVTLFKKGDVLFGKLRPYLEKYYLAEFDGKCTGEILAFEPLKIQGRFLLYCISSTWFIGQCNMLAYGAKMPRVNWPTQLAKINIPLPLKDEQVQIADYLDDKCGEISSLKKNIVDQIFTLDQYRKSLIHECVTGKRRITEADMRVVQQY